MLKVVMNSFFSHLFAFLAEFQQFCLVSVLGLYRFILWEPGPFSQLRSSWSSNKEIDVL